MDENNSVLQRLLGEPIRNMSNSFYDGYVEVNARFRQRAGLKSVIIRRQLANCCEWCAALAGTYDYDNAPADVYRRHDNCKCMVTVRTEKGVYRDAWSKNEFRTQRAARIQREREFEEERRAREENRSHMTELLLRIDEMMHPLSGERRKEFNRLIFMGAPSETELIRRAAEGENQSNNQGIIARHIINGDYPLRYLRQKYQDHEYGTVRYQNTSRDRGRPQSFLYVPMEVALGLVYQYAGMGTLKGTSESYVENKEFVDVGFPVGVYYHQGEPIETCRICIQYSSRGVHVYPVEER